MELSHKIFFLQTILFLSRKLLICRLILLAVFLMIFAIILSQNSATSLSNDLGIVITSDLGKYLMAPMLHQRISKNSYSFLLDRMRKNISRWKAMSLSFAGWIILAQSSLMSIPGMSCRLRLFLNLFVWKHSRFAGILSGEVQWINVNVTLLLGRRFALPKRKDVLVFRTFGFLTRLI